jgi:dihydropteroate synthase
MLLRAPRDREITLGGKTRLMGVLNVTPDSFSDGGRYLDPEAATAHGLRLVEEGAEILDIGGESTRPGHEPVPAEQQLQRILPVIRELSERVSVPISVDTTSAEVAAAAVRAGAHWINDTSALRHDPELGAVAAEHGCPLVLMHRFEPARGPASEPRGAALVDAIAADLERAVERARTAGVEDRQILLDPGLGFGTTAADNPSILAHLHRLRRLGRPLLIGPSRKSFLGQLTGRPTHERVYATAAVVATMALQGVEVVRVHDIAAMADVIAVVDAMARAAS